LENILMRSVRTNPIKLMEPVQSFNSFMLGERLHDLSFGLVAEPFYVYSGNFSMLGVGVDLSGEIVKNLIGKFGIYAAKMNYSGDFDDFAGMIYGTGFGVQYKDSDFYVKTVGVLSSAKFRDIDVFDGVESVSNPSGISGATAFDGGVVFNIFDDFELVSFVGVRFDYSKVLKFSDVDTNLRFGLNFDTNSVVDGNKYSLGLQSFVQTNGEAYAAIYTEMMSVADGMGGRLGVGLLHDDSGMSYKITFDAKFVF